MFWRCFITALFAAPIAYLAIDARDDTTRIAVSGIVAVGVGTVAALVFGPSSAKD